MRFRLAPFALHFLFFIYVQVVSSRPAPAADDEGDIQGVAARGRLLCGDQPLANTTVKIIDRDEARGDPDDLLDETMTDSSGDFALAGATREVGQMRAAIKIYHNCMDDARRKVVWDIPVEFNNNGTVVQYFDVGAINMQLVFKGEERDCRHRRKRRHHHHHREGGRD